MAENCSLVDFVLWGYSVTVRFQVLGGIESFEEVLPEELCLHYRAYY